MSSVRILRIFVSSPGDVAQERALLDEVVDRINRVDGQEHNVRLEIFRWEVDVLPQIGPSPQEVVDEQTPSYDIYLGIMGARFGSPTARHESGTEHELRQAWDQWRRVGAPWILFYFRDQPDVAATPEAAEQWTKVVNFRDELQMEGIVCVYSEPSGSTTGFREQVEEHLRRLIRRAPPARELKPFLVFTSTSPRRKQLLEQIGFREERDFVMEGVSVTLDEERDDTMTLVQAKELARRTAQEKINHALKYTNVLLNHGLNPRETLVIGADTMVFCRDHLLDRPLLKALEFAGPLDIERAIAKAKEMLAQQRGETIHVITALVIARADDPSRGRSSCVVTSARMKNFSDREIDSYVRTREPFDKAGAFGIQEKGVALFEELVGSYTNVVGLPLNEFRELLADELFEERVRPPSGGTAVTPNLPLSVSTPELSAVSVGDINYDFVYDRLPEGIFRSMEPPGKKLKDELYRGAGGTAVMFARGARKAGFKECSVLGVVGGDVLGEAVEHELQREGIQCVLPRDHGQKTSVAIVLRDRGREDTSLMLTDSHQQLPRIVAERAKADIERADVFYMSGYCLTDPNRRSTACEMARTASNAGRLVVLDVVVGMAQEISYTELLAMLRDDISGRTCVDILVAEVPEIASWLGLSPPEEVSALGEFLEESVFPILHRHFTTFFIRTASYSHEAISSPAGVRGPYELDYRKKSRRPRLGYGDAQTARHVSAYLSPRILLASRSPQRLDLLRQIIAANKIEVRVSDHEESIQPAEAPKKRVERLALEKAERVIEQGAFSPTIEIVLGADTELVLPVSGQENEIVSHPRDVPAAKELLARLSGKTFEVVTGLALIGCDPATGSLKRLTDSVITEVTFRRLSPQEIHDYACTGEPLGRAGGFAIQGRGILLVEEIKGSYSNVVGLPLERLADILDQEFGTPIWEIDKVSSWQFPRPLREEVQ
jgi:septum formation protein